jgi:hypothetical protein
MPKPAHQWLDDSSMFNFPRHRTLPGFEIALHFLFFGNGFKFGSHVDNHVAFKSESVTASFFEKSHPEGLTRSYLNTDLLLNPVDYFHCPIPVDFYVLFFFGIFVLVFADINSSDLKYELRRSTCLPFHNSNSDFDIAVAHFRASRPGMQASRK